MQDSDACMPASRLSSLPVLVLFEFISKLNATGSSLDSLPRFQQNGPVPDANWLCIPGRCSVRP